MKKLGMLFRLLFSKDAILITLEGEDYGFLYHGKSEMFNGLALKLIRYVPDWCYKWKKAKERKEEKDGEQAE